MLKKVMGQYNPFSARGMSRRDKVEQMDGMPFGPDPLPFPSVPTKNITMKQMITLLFFFAMATSCKSTKPMPTSNPNLTNTYWQLTELRGQPINSPDGAKPYYIKLDAAANRFSAWAGCNRMMGSFSNPDGFKVSFGKVASTMMACPDMTLEKQLAEVLEMADNYGISEKSLSLNKARMAPLARFVAIPEPK
jgi:heat shock protein HslJ